MTCIHPSEKPPLGWLVPCLAAADLQATLDFYRKLDLVQCGGDVAEGWAVLRNRAVEIHVFHGHIPADLLNFRGGDVPALRAALTERGLTVDRDIGPWSVIYRDPDGREVFFDSAAEEHARYATGQPLTISVPGDVHAGTGLDLGNLTWCLACAELAATRRFYETLGMWHAGGEPGNEWTVLGRVDHPLPHGTRQVCTYLSLFEGVIPRDMLNLRGGDVARIASVLGERGVGLGKGVVTAEDGGESLMVEDPDGRPVFFDTTPPERLAAR